MTQLCCRRMFHLNMKTKFLLRISFIQNYLQSLWKNFFSCWIRKSCSSYRQLSLAATTTILSPYSSPPPTIAIPGVIDHKIEPFSSDLVSVKICLFGDCQIGKTSFLTKYAGEENTKDEIVASGINRVDKMMYVVGGTRISYSIWEVSGEDSSSSIDHIQAACKDSAAMLFMFDLTSRCTLNSVITWYQQARKSNQNALPVIIGSKFDEFVQLPLDLQWTIASQARGYAKAMNATLFFSSATYNINVNKVFKFITAKLFNLPWSVDRNLTIGEPIIDY